MAEKKHVLSVIVLTKNSKTTIEKCLSSIVWVDEIVVVDNGSVDETVNIAKKFKARVIENAKGNFSDRRNIGAKEAKGVWLLYIDADEKVTPVLKKEILSQITKHHSPSTAFAIPRRNILLGHEMKHGGWWPDYVIRLVKKDSLIGWEGELHEQPVIRGLPAGRQGKIGKLKNPLIHNTHRSLTAMVEKTNDWSEIEAKLMYDANHPKMNIIRFFTAAFREFWYRAIRKYGFLDGPVGIIEIIYQVFSRFVSYAKLWEMQLQSERVKE